MPMFNVKFSREVSVTDFYEEEVEAATVEEARAKAKDLAWEFNDSCPDGTTQGDVTVCKDWGIETVTPVAATAEA